MSETMLENAAPPVPAHVPADLVRQFDFVSDLGDRPHEAVAALIGGPRIFYTPAIHNTHATGLGAWVPTRAEDIRAVFLDPKTFSSSGFTSMAAMIGDTWVLAPLESDPPGHARFRAALSPHFLQKPINTLIPIIREGAIKLISAFASRGECDFIKDFAKVMPTTVFLGLMGLPLEDAPMFLEWERQIIHGNNVQERVDGVRAVRDFMADYIARRRRDPGDDLISSLMKAHPENPFDDHELLGMGILLYTSGLDTVANSLSAQCRHLADHPGQQAALVDDADLIPKAVEELVRLYSPVGPFRIVTRDVELAGVSMKAGDRVLLSTTLASRDPGEFDNANGADFDRDNLRHYGFGFGMHHCLGVHLARREMIITWEEWFRLIPQPFRIKPGAKVPAHGGSVLGYSSLPLVWDC